MPYDFSGLQKKLMDANEWIHNEYQGLRTGRATPALLDIVQVDAYGSRTPLKQIASVSVEDARVLRVSPFDASLTKEIEKAIASADLGVGINVADTSIRVSFPELTTERREEIIKVAKHKLEEARTGVRAARDEVWNDIQKKEKEGDISEDDKFRLKEELQNQIDEANRGLEAVFNKKEEEISS
ncbi:MAG: ribosome recycling factor [Candidatus Taylorbacteria bacterium CG10_big_fil_rev_8_21_14_0_10_41_48]|uniref:Ribosome recycling factor n=1 Tax=Candidatus Taylorbacteria bacterium CG10_big_fil_rev_8_21_14_0_10_41_48 TaxID=1975024 RepID=A0A2M8LCQ3_9BACT|nr:MAG: ribosome recycling factor [Candidatus Taylorbacteria bacterium CG10_big_fil_rev_8_21_14_0_10_41_48]